LIGEGGPRRQGSIADCGSRRARKRAQLEAELDELDRQAGSASVLSRLLSHSWAERGNQTMCARPDHSEQAQRILSEEPPRIETGEDVTRYVEAWMVRSGASSSESER
jgi:hypothetical protein